MSGGHLGEADLEARALAWVHRRQELICDQITPWEHGTVYRASRYPWYFDLNAVVVQDGATVPVDELIEIADQTLDGLAHRRIDFDSAVAGEPLRAEFHARGFQATRLLWMRFDGPRPREAAGAVVEVSDDAVTELRRAWHAEEFPDEDASLVREFLASAHEVRQVLGSRTLAVHEDSRLVAFATLDVGDDEAEVGAVYVVPDHRGRGLGTTVTGAAIAAANDVRDLWICADDEDRPKQLYARLGFRPVTTTTEFLRLPSVISAEGSPVGS